MKNNKASKEVFYQIGIEHDNYYLIRIAEHHYLCLGVSRDNVFSYIQVIYVRRNVAYHTNMDCKVLRRNELETITSMLNAWNEFDDLEITEPQEVIF